MAKKAKARGKIESDSAEAAMFFSLQSARRRILW